ARKCVGSPGIQRPAESALRGRAYKNVAPAIAVQIGGPGDGKTKMPAGLVVGRVQISQERTVRPGEKINIAGRADILVKVLRDCSNYEIRFAIAIDVRRRGDRKTKLAEQILVWR